MKSVLISIQPKWCELIASGKKTIEVRKTLPKVKEPFKVYIYCTNWKDNIYWKNHYKDKLGKVIGEFVCEVVTVALSGHYWILPKSKTLIDELDLLDYADGKTVYGWHISDLVIYDKPRELSEFKHKCNGVCVDTKKMFKCERFIEEGFKCNGLNPITRPPQSWCYVESEVEGE